MMRMRSSPLPRPRLFPQSVISTSFTRSVHDATNANAAAMSIPPGQVPPTPVSSAITTRCVAPLSQPEATRWRVRPAHHDRRRRMSPRGPLAAKNREELERSRLQFRLGSLGNTVVRFFLFLFFFFSKSPSASQIPSTIVERLAEYESGRLADRERIEELGQRVARLEAENRSLREWSSDRFMSLWESTKGQDVTVVQALQNIHALQVEDNARQNRIQQTARNLEGLLRNTTIGTMPALPSVPPLRPGRSLPPITLPVRAPSVAPESPLSPVPGSPVPEEDSDEEITATTPKTASNKRGHSAVSESSTKRQRQG